MQPMDWMQKALQPALKQHWYEEKEMKYILGIDQSTQGTKAVLFDSKGQIVSRADFAHRQIVNEKGWVSHDLNEIYDNLCKAVKKAVSLAGISDTDLVAVGISNQRETTAAWRKDGSPVTEAVVWQCARAAEIADRYQQQSEEIREKTGLKLSPYFPAAKMAWLLENGTEPENLHLGTIDSYLIYRLTGGKSFRTDYSNASRTQLFNLHTLSWDKDLTDLFGISTAMLPEVCDSDSCFGETDFEGAVSRKIPIYAVMGDSHAALYGHGCVEKGMAKTTYGTGSSIMMNIGDQFIKSSHGLVTSLAWSRHGKTEYVLEGNINYTGAVISWLQNDMHLISSPAELEQMIQQAHPEDATVLVPAFSGLSAPYWKNEAKAMIYGMSRTTGRNEIARAAVESIALQITDVLEAMKADCTDLRPAQLRVDGGPTRNRYLMQFQSTMAQMTLAIPEHEELSAIGAAYMAGTAAGLYPENIFTCMNYKIYHPSEDLEYRTRKYTAWKNAVEKVLI